jgi:hypothetical protein
VPDSVRDVDHADTQAHRDDHVGRRLLGPARECR